MTKGVFREPWNWVVPRLAWGRGTKAVCSHWALSTGAGWGRSQTALRMVPVPGFAKWTGDTGARRGALLDDPMGGAMVPAEDTAGAEV